jgi:hypothetical protein
MTDKLRDVLLGWETFEYDKQLIAEARAQGLLVILKGVLQRADTLN